MAPQIQVHQVVILRPESAPEPTTLSTPEGLVIDVASPQPPPSPLYYLPPVEIESQADPAPYSVLRELLDTPLHQDLGQVYAEIRQRGEEPDLGALQTIVEEWDFWIVEEYQKNPNPETWSPQLREAIRALRPPRMPPTSRFRTRLRTREGVLVRITIPPNL